MATDTRTAKLPVGSYILNYGASKTYPWMKQVAGMFNTDNGDMENYQNAILTNNEIYVPPDGVEAIGVEKLEYMNNEPKEGAHDSINNLMVMNTLKNLKPMYGGGEVKPMMGYEDGGEVSSEQYAGLIGKMIGKFGGEVPEGMYTPEGGLTRAGYAKMIGASPESVDIDTMSFINPANYSFKVSGKGAESGADVGGTTTASVLPLKALLDKTMRQNIKAPVERMDWQMRLGDVKPAGYQDGDVVGYQQGEQVVDPNDPLGINERQAMGAQAYAGSTIAEPAVE